MAGHGTTAVPKTGFSVKGTLESRRACSVEDLAAAEFSSDTLAIAPWIPLG